MTTTIAKFNELCDFSIPLQQLIAEKAEQMFRDSAIESTLRLGKHEVCLKRPDASTKTISVYLMHGTMEMNEEVVTRYNKRNKVRPSKIDGGPEMPNFVGGIS